MRLSFNTACPRLVACLVIAGCCLSFPVTSLAITGFDAAPAVTMLDSTGITINGPINPDISCDDYNEANNFGGVLIEATTDCAGGQTMVTFTDIAMSAGCAGMYERTYEISDECGNVATYVQYVTLTDNEAPTFTITCPPTAEIYVDGYCEENRDPSETGEPTVHNVYDNCDSDIYISKTYVDEDQPGDCPGEYSILRTWTVIGLDECYNFTTETCTQTITVLDTLAPAWVVYPEDLEIACSAVDQDLIDNWLESNGGAQIVDNCGGITWSHDYTGQNVECAIQPEVTVTFTATDACGNATSTTALILAGGEDITPPVWQDYEQYLMASCEGMLTLDQAEDPTIFPISAVDDCSSDIQYDIEAFELSGECPRTWLRIWTATDGCGNMSDPIEQDIQLFDETDPTVTAPADITVYLDDYCNYNAGPEVTGYPTLYDACTSDEWLLANRSYNDVINPVSCDGDDNSVQGSFTITRTWSTTDYCLNDGSDTQTITVVDDSAPAKPIINCPADVTRYRNNNCYTNLAPHIGANCGGTGVLTIDYPLTSDPNGPVLTVDHDLIPDSPFAADCVDDPAITSSYYDNCSDDNDLTPVIAYTDNPVGDQNCTHYIERVWTAYFIDGCGNQSETATCTQLITIVDDIDPTINAPDIVVACEDFHANPNAIYATVNDNCDPNVTLELIDQDIIMPGTCAGLYYNTYRATDCSGNIITVSHYLTLADNTAPIFLTFPADTIVECGAGTTPEDLGTPTATDNCADTGDLTLEYEDIVVTFQDEDCQTIERLWTIIDPCGNSHTAIQTYGIEDTGYPTITIPANDLTVQSDGEGNIGEFNNWLATHAGSQAVDDCSIIIWDFEVPVISAGSNPQLSDGCGATGEVTISFYATDACGNSTPTTATFTVVDTLIPQLSNIVLPDDITLDQNANCDRSTGVDVTGVPSADVSCCIAFVDISHEDGAISCLCTPDDDQLFVPQFNEEELFTYCETEAEIAGTVSFDWDYNTDDIDGAMFDVALYVDSELSDVFGADEQSGSYSVEVGAGETIGFGIMSLDGLYGGASLLISNFSGPSGAGFIDVYDEANWVQYNGFNGIHTFSDDGTTLLIEGTNVDLVCEGSYEFTRTWTLFAYDECGNESEELVHQQIITVIDNTAPEFIATVGLSDGALIDINYDDASGDLNLPEPCQLVAADNCDADVAITCTVDTLGEYAPLGDVKNYCLATNPAAYANGETCNNMDPHALRLLSIPNGDIYYTMDEAVMTEYDSGEVMLTCSLSSTVVPDAGWILHLSLLPEQNVIDAIAAGADASDFCLNDPNFLGNINDLISCANVVSEIGTLDFTKYILDCRAGDGGQPKSRLVGIDSYGGSQLDLRHQPANSYFAFQIGYGANKQNAEYGMSGLFFWEGHFLGQSATGSGDFSCDLDCTLPWQIQHCCTAVDDCGNEEVFCYIYNITGDVEDGDGTDMLVLGCLDPDACNFNPDACVDDGLCTYATGPCEVCESGEVLALDADGDGICDGDEVSGCTDESACNYNPLATNEDGSCFNPEYYEDCDGNCLSDSDGDGICDEVEVPGCTVDFACNYNPTATDDDGSCDYAQEFLSCNGNCLNDADGDGICDEFEVPGCTDEFACNFNPSATDDDGSCDYPENFLDCDGNCLEDTDGDGICDEFEVSGCTDPEANNYNPWASEDDGGCLYPPSNDTPEMAQATACFLTISGSLENANGDEYSGTNVLGNDIATGGSVWYEFNSDNDYLVRFSTCLSADMDDGVAQTDLIAFQLNVDGTLTPLATLENDDVTGCAENESDVQDSWLQLQAEQGKNYLIRVSNGTDNSDQSQFQIQTICEVCPAGFPGNDEACEADVMVPGSYNGSVACSSSDEDVEIPGLDSSAVPRGVWYQLEVNPDFSQYVLTVDATGEGAIGWVTYSGSACSELAPISSGVISGSMEEEMDQFNDAIETGPTMIGFLNPDSSSSYYLYLWSTSHQFSSQAIFGFSLIAGNGGCLDVDACNYFLDWPQVEVDCLYPEDIWGAPYYDCSGFCLNDADGDGVCDEDEVPGCMYENACNFNPEATEDDGGCDFDSCSACTDQEACNYGLPGECIYAESPCEYCREDGTIGNQVCNPLEVEVIMDTILYDGLGDLSAGYRRYRLYAKIPGGSIMLGPVADDVSDPIIPAFGFDAPCGCFNYTSGFVPNGYNNGANINPGFISVDQELAYDTWWTAHVPQITSGTNVIETIGAFPAGFNSCTDEVVQGAIVVTPADPIHASVENGRALIGQITTCESFSFKVCVAMHMASNITTYCTEGDVTVPDLCAPFDEVSLSVGQFGVVVDAPPLAPSVRWRLLDAGSSDVLFETYDPAGFAIEADGDYVVQLYDTARTTAWSSNTCLREIPLEVLPGTLPVQGCTFPGALNYDADASIDDGSCLIAGCMDEEALNFLPFATVPAQCIYNAPGCVWDAELGDWDCSEYCASDINQDGIVSVPDLLILLGEFAGGCTP